MGALLLTPPGSAAWLRGLPAGEGSNPKASNLPGKLQSKAGLDFCSPVGRAAEPARLLVISGRAVKTPYKRRLASEPETCSEFFRCTWELYLLCIIGLIKIRIWSLCYIPINDRAGI